MDAALGLLGAVLVLHALESAGPFPAVAEPVLQRHLAKIKNDSKTSERVNSQKRKGRNNYNFMEITTINMERKNKLPGTGEKKHTRYHIMMERKPKQIRNKLSKMRPRRTTKSNLSHTGNRPIEPKP